MWHYSQLHSARPRMHGSAVQSHRRVVLCSRSCKLTSAIEQPVNASYHVARSLRNSSLPTVSPRGPKRGCSRYGGWPAMRPGAELLGLVAVGPGRSVPSRPGSETGRVRLSACRAGLALQLYRDCADKRIRASYARPGGLERAEGEGGARWVLREGGGQHSKRQKQRYM